VTGDVGSSAKLYDLIEIYIIAVEHPSRQQRAGLFQVFSLPAGAPQQRYFVKDLGEVALWAAVGVLRYTRDVTLHPEPLGSIGGVREPASQTQNLGTLARV
jgi:hypothetical protein